MQLTTLHPNHPQPTRWSLGMGMAVCVSEIRYSPESETAGKLKLGFADNSLTKEAGR